ncbi:hypothetical protein N836_32840 [Leptolyngbya sp. Heron Island J]|nr:hypothetical protein [Leptolyngbya sp. Heron Island J]ESA38217.1 hypothetical protein N836_32840 [Leptolyngbya sp. Heron Island J]
MAESGDYFGNPLINIRKELNSSAIVVSKTVLKDRSKGIQKIEKSATITEICMCRRYWIGDGALLWLEERLQIASASDDRDKE